jgi:hypothetical protein
LLAFHNPSHRGHSKAAFLSLNHEMSWKNISAKVVKENKQVNE